MQNRPTSTERGCRAAIICYGNSDYFVTFIAFITL